MKRTLLSQSRSALTALILGSAMVMGMMSAPALAQLDAATNSTAAATNEAASSQDRIDQIDDETTDIVTKYRTTIDLLDSLKEYNAQKREIIKDQVRRMASLRKQMTNVEGIQREILPLIFSDEKGMVPALDLFIHADLPFLMGERETRIEALKALETQSNVSAAEKYRKALEAYQIENDYGRSIEAYEGELEDGRSVNFVKIGRVALFYQTIDKSETMMWNNETREWDARNGDRDEVDTAIRMAREQIPPDLLIVPVPAASAN